MPGRPSPRVNSKAPNPNAASLGLAAFAEALARSRNAVNISCLDDGVRSP